MIEYTVQPGSTGDCPPVYPGLRVHLTVCPEIEALDCLRIIVLLSRVLEDGWYAGEVLYDFDEIRQGMVFRFQSHHVERVDGGIDYMKKYQRITVDRAVMEGVPPKVLYYGMLDDPWHCHKFVSCIDGEAGVVFETIPVADLLERVPSIAPYLDHLEFTNFYWNGKVVAPFNFVDPNGYNA